MNLWWIIASVVLGVVVIGYLVGDYLFGRSHRVDRRIGQMRRERNPHTSETSRLFRDLHLVETGKHEIRERVRRFIEQSGVATTVPRILAASAAAGFTMAAVALALRSSLALVPVAALVPGGIPWMIVAWKRRRRIELLRNQLPEAFEAMGRAVQAGQSVPASLLIVSQEARLPLAREFACACEQHNLGLSFEQTMQDLSRRVPVLELRILAIALIVQRQAGGNPVEIITNMTDLIRKRARLAARIRALTGEGRMQAIVLTLLPIFAFFGLWIGRPEYIQCLLDRPRILQGLLSAQIVAAIWIRRIVRLDF